MRRLYENMDRVETKKTLRELRRWRAERKIRMKTKDFSFVVPNKAPEVEWLHDNRTQLSVSWIGHSTFLIQVGGLNVVTDPVWATRMGLEKRLTSPGIPLAEMPPIDIILISHSHYDHLHFRSIRKLVNPNTLLIVPEGLRDKMQRKVISETKEMAWWDQLQIASLRVTCVPAQHWTRRTITDMNHSHWGGYVIERLDTERENVVETIYFAGDSGYFRGFKQIGERFDIDIALLPIGAYEPEWFMSSQHVTPEEAVQAFEDVGATYMIPMHYGSFKLADDSPREALDRLESARAVKNIAVERVRVLAHGETWKLPE
ncbi:MBL fold metallo-hydrolase [Paenibacillus sp. 481]|uniref:MBL fold metallo-hydrolase n=1 Tax=Paenibacillus sp. 481 TaxID=2835869 RepID=UPI001E2DA07D|nr:MBL fold metallo-hydrolase [Paenibacillus sp. 481]UHA71904.1 MBL fold metallo-hydrolase [Paenibacillus sp. 481]